MTVVETTIEQPEPGARVAVVHLASPPANALSEAVIGGLEAACDLADAEGAGAMVLVSDVPGFFVAGADLKLLGNVDRDRFAAYLDRLRAVLERIANAGRVSIAAVDGMALGGGLELAVAATLRVATPQARFGVPEVKLGLLPGAAGTQRLPRMIGRGPALDLLLTGRSADGEEAHRLGLCERLVPAGTAAAEALIWAAAFARGPRHAHAAILRCADAARDLPFGDGMAVERAEVLGLFDSPDGREGVQAFLGKRAPRFGA